MAAARCRYRRDGALLRLIHYNAIQLLSTLEIGAEDISIWHLKLFAKHSSPDRPPRAIEPIAPVSIDKSRDCSLEPQAKPEPAPSDPAIVIRKGKVASA